MTILPRSILALTLPLCISSSLGGCRSGELGEAPDTDAESSGGPGTGTEAGDAPEGPGPGDDDGGEAADGTDPAESGASDDDAPVTTTDASSTAADDTTGDDASSGGVDAPFVISNEDDFGPLLPTGLELGPPNGTFDTDVQCTEDAVLGICEAVTTATAYACVCRADRLVVGDLRVVGSRALVLLAWSRVEIVGALDLGGEAAQYGAGASFEYADEADGSLGGAGGSFGTAGARDAADTYGTSELIPLQGGMNGQSACGDAPGGGGGGALQISAGEEIVVVGIVNAGGGGGEGGSASDACCIGGPGGGCGGGVLLESLDVQVAGVVAANGGGGGSGGTTSYLGDAGDDAVSIEAAPGGSAQSEEPCLLGDTVYSGAGGVGAAQGDAPGDGGPSDDETACFENADVYAGQGGGGGGMGRIRINTVDGAQGCLCAGDFSPTPTFGSVGA
jgi:hypothetical protein